ncbi:hypothetical protein MF410_34225 (plasmid) [Rhizobium sp. C104]|uniref:hypothetical protein n=1 Tax=Rhizobium sp. C104 TaxID=2917727 RepID=UPI001EF9B34B|nr:hypothetical protein [Rhizobium sp. C104]ULJ82696.1 hypothetical protein MF410_34225 [Rhizobium sp. C104]
MRIAQRSAYAIRLAGTFYAGGSVPISVVKPEDDPLRLDWWTTNFQAEGADSDRHVGALQLYLALSGYSKIELPNNTFPARLDFDDQSMRPDKGVIKVLLDKLLVKPRMMGAQLVFDVTEAGQSYLAERTAETPR